MASRKPVALITGGAKGIGRAIARNLVDSGWHLGVIDLPDSGVRRTYPTVDRKVLAIEGDVRDESTVADAVAATVQRFGRLDAAVCNAGIMIRKPLRQLTLAEWHRVIDTNLTAAFLLARAAETPLRKARGAFLTIASTRTLMSEANTESYSASKGGLVRSPMRWRSVSGRRCASIASAPVGSQPRTTARCAARIMPSIPWGASANRTISPNWSPFS
jgi:NAD(P)-dependent dehydrogenase (short-subunit alcohol dehydrogenase family)